jgi:eukaryotic-like serine/threonine-protein kinase
MPDLMTDLITRVQTALAERYAVHRELGRGATATVYLAEDLKHHRRVAIKILRPELSATLGRERFLREIEVAAGLEHPHILALHDSGEAEGFLYYVMPYVEGKSLRDRLNEEKRLPLEEAVRLTQEVADALGYAHSRGLVHRDIKPENLLLAQGGARVADFGIARAIAEAAGENLTGTGMAVGTPAYMSPEQAAGSGELDGRSDLYSLGCVLYEMLAGEPPFTGPNAQAVIAKRWSDPVPQISKLRDVPPAVEQALEGALATAPADRFATAKQFAAALTATGAATVPSRAAAVRPRRRRMFWLGAPVALAAVVAVFALWSRQQRAPAVAVDPNVVAVLPFRVTARDSAYNYLREGIVDLLNARLTGDGVPRGVDSRTTLSRWRQAVTATGGELTTSRSLSVAQSLGAGQLLLGEFVATSSGMTVSGRLLRVPDGDLVAEHSEMGRIGKVDELALVDRWLGRVMATTVGEGAGRLPQLSDSMAAVKAYLAGLRAHRRGDWAAANAHYQRALEIDSTFALAAYWRAIASFSLNSAALIVETGRKAWSLRARLSAGDQAQLSAEWGVGPNYPEPYTLAQLIEAAERAAALNPDRPEAFDRLGGYLLLHGAAASIDGWFLKAVGAADSAIRLDPTYSDAVWTRLFAALIEGNAEDIRRLESLYFRTSSAAEFRDVVRWVAASTLKDSAALASLRGRFDQLSGEGMYSVVGLSLILGLPLNDADRAITHLTARTVSERCDRLRLLQSLAAVRGQVARALAFADSANRAPDCGVRMITITMGLADSGYGTAPEPYARQLSAIPETEAGPWQVCFAELWRVSQGDTSRTRRAIERIRRLTRTRDPVPLGVGRRGVCPGLLGTWVEAMRRQSGAAPMLMRLDSLMRQGTGLELPGNLANLLLAHWLEARGDLPGALAAVRRRVYAANDAFTMLYPAYLREEGRLAALTGDTAGAIRAYQHFLTLRDRPDPGPMQDEVRQVKAHLAELVGEKGRR